MHSMAIIYSLREVVGPKSITLSRHLICACCADAMIRGVNLNDGNSGDKNWCYLT